MLNQTYHSMGRRSIDFSGFLLSYKFPWISVSSSSVIFSERLFLPFPCVLRIQWPGLVFFSLCLHLWEVRMSGILKTDTASRRSGGHTRIGFV
jgi:hypothetical protein